MTPDIELRHIRYFLAVAEELSFTRAAKRLNIAQPALSHQIRQLEQRLNTDLFTRSPRVALTPAGSAFQLAGRRALTHITQAAAIATKVGSGRRAVLHVGLSSAASLTRFPRVVRAFTQQHPDIEIRIREMHSNEQLEALRTGALDAGVVRETPSDNPFEMHALLRELLILILPARHRLARYKTVSLSRCADEAFVLFPRTGAPMLHDQISAMCREAGFIPRVENEAHEWHTIAALVAAGFGVSIAPASVAGIRVAGSTLRRLSPSENRTALYLCAPAAPTSEPLRLFTRFVTSAMARSV
ncbi:MAG: LysR family transcriptional regulator [Gemmatimonadaceae bacterium]